MEVTNYLPTGMILQVAPDRSLSWRDDWHPQLQIAPFQAALDKNTIINWLHVEDTRTLLKF